MRQLILIENLEDGEVETSLYFEDDVEIAHNGPFITIKDTASVTILNISNLIGFSLVDVVAAEESRQAADAIRALVGCPVGCDCHDPAEKDPDGDQFDCNGLCQKHCADCVTRQTIIQQEIDDENS